MAAEAAPGPGAPAPVPPAPVVDLRTVSRRDALPGCAEPLPFAALGADGLVRLPDGIPETQAGPIFIPLPPVIPEVEPWRRALRHRASLAPSTLLAVGLSNVSHLALAEELSSSENLWFFVDFPLYVANHHASAFCRRHVPRLLFQYSWIEGSAEDHAALKEAVPPATTLVRIDPAFKPPLFYSLGCFEKHVGNGGACLDDCPKDFAAELRQGRNAFRVVVRGCVTYLFQR